MICSQDPVESAILTIISETPKTIREICDAVDALKIFAAALRYETIRARLKRLARDGVVDVVHERTPARRGVLLYKTR
ncbi:MAG: hypothetical protein M0R66_03845 [Candidatus Omnitrophica bacterium]|nr:hypothetical protein [Candidatus Omnitrophota bacterium]